MNNPMLDEICEKYGLSPDQFITTEELMKMGMPNENYFFRNPDDKQSENDSSNKQ